MISYNEVFIRYIKYNFLIYNRFRLGTQRQSFVYFFVINIVANYSALKALAVGEI